MQSELVLQKTASYAIGLHSSPCADTCGEEERRKKRRKDGGELEEIQAALVAVCKTLAKKSDV